jgi:hypothetical protein
MAFTRARRLAPRTIQDETINGFPDQPWKTTSPGITMKRLFSLIIVTAFIASAAPLAAQAAPVDIFSCSLGHKSVSVTATGQTLNYTYGAPGKPEMTLTGDPKSGNVYYMTQRPAGIEHQLRFLNGTTSYTVFNMEGNNAGAMASSGLVVMQGTKTLATLSCVRYTEFGVAYDYSILPVDTDAYSAM